MRGEDQKTREVRCLRTGKESGRRRRDSEGLMQKGRGDRLPNWLGEVMKYPRE
jgi:hypothetical protein